MGFIVPNQKHSHSISRAQQNNLVLQGCPMIYILFFFYFFKKTSFLGISCTRIIKKVRFVHKAAKSDIDAR